MPSAEKSDLSIFWIIAIILVSTIIPRFASIGFFPFLDDGYHAFMAQYTWHSLASGAGFPDDITGYKLFPLLFAWVHALPGNALVWLRCADLIFAIIAAWLLCILLARESGSKTFGLWLAFATLCGLNLPGAIQAGFKHSFFPAFACLFLALLISQRATPKSTRWLYAGMLAALGVLFRETFFPFALLGCIALLCARNFSAFWRFTLGGILGLIIITGISALLRGQFQQIFDFYLTYGQIYGPEAGRRWLKFVENGGKAFVLLLPLVLLFLFAFLRMLIAPAKSLRGRALFWLAAACLPIVEPLLKIGFLYHFTVCLPGMAGFCAYIYRQLPQGYLPKTANIAAILAALIIMPELYGHLERLPVTLQTLANYPAKGWPESLADESTTLEAARAAAELAPTNGRISSTGFAYFLFPASGFLPPQVALGDLSRTFIYSDRKPDKFKERLLQNPPDLVFIGHAVEDHSEIFEKELQYIFQQLPEYEKAVVIETNPAKNYGWLGYTVYKRRS